MVRYVTPLSHTWICYVVALLLFLPIAHAAILSPGDAGFADQTRSDNYDALVAAMCSNSAVVTVVGDKLWVPWYSTSTSCAVNDLQRGGNCDSGETIDSTHNCMVTDEFSQVGILVAMSKDQTRMDQFFNTVNAIKSSHGQIPAWRVYRSGSSIDACRQGINGNCDTASDATARIIIALFTASDNTYFTNQAQRAAYRALAVKLSEDFLAYEVVNSCLASNQGYGDICWWLASGSEAKNGGLASNDFAFTGYYGDAIDAMLMACSATNNMTYCAVAGNFTLNYLQAANFNGETFTAPPGKSFKWVVAAPDAVPIAVCTNTCSPVQWDGADAPRALGICQANYYAQQMGIELPRLRSYCALWGNRYYTSASIAPLQFSPAGVAVVGGQSGFFAQGLEALYQSGGSNPSLFAPTLDNALAHYSPGLKTWDNSACFGVYTEAFAIRALGFGIGRDAASFRPVSSAVTQSVTTPVASGPPLNPSSTAGSMTSTSCASKVNDLDVTCIGGSITRDEKSGCRTITCTNAEDSMVVQACDKPDGGPVTYFEMYRQRSIGTRIRQLCIGQACISDGGFARGEYPVCRVASADGVQTGGDSADTGTIGTPQATVNVGIAPWFPQGKNYVFTCNAAGMVPTSYDWSFGDGQRQYDATRNDVYHTFGVAGDFAVTCTAKNGQVAKVGMLNVAVR